MVLIGCQDSKLHVAVFYDCCGIIDSLSAYDPSNVNLLFVMYMCDSEHTVK